MTYYTDDAAQTGEPIELFRFDGPSASFVYFYTSYQEDVVFGGDTYAATAVERNELLGAGLDDQQELTVRLPVSAQVIQDFAFVVAPRSLKLTIYRMHTLTGANITFWEGDVLGIRANGNMAEVRTISIIDHLLDQKCPNVFHQSLCNHKFGDTRCGVNLAGTTTSPAGKQITFPTTVASIVDSTSFVATSVQSTGDTFYPTGEVVRVSDGERRLIVSQSGTTLGIEYPFPELNATDSIQLIAGCNHNIFSDCVTKFSNGLRHGGSPWIPNANIHRLSLRVLGGN